MCVRLFRKTILMLVLSGLLTVDTSIGANADDVKCQNPGKVTYLKSPSYKAPDGTRGVGLRVAVNGETVPVPDLRPECLPIAIRYYNYGVLKTRQRGPWPGQIAKDHYGHAVFATVRDGLAAWTTWIKDRTHNAPKSAFELMSIYAPPDDCVGSVGKPPNCPYGINPTLDYAKRVAAAVQKAPYEKLKLDPQDCAEGRKALYSVFIQVATFEIGASFCGGTYSIDVHLFEDTLAEIGGKCPA
jgi:hypothetical protein